MCILLKCRKKSENNRDNEILEILSNKYLRHYFLTHDGKLRITLDEDIIYYDTLEYAMASADGSWLGSGFNEIKESKLWWKGGVILLNEEPLIIEVSQAVRNNGEEKGISKLKGIISVGISIEDQ